MMVPTAERAAMTASSPIASGSEDSWRSVRFQSSLRSEGPRPAGPPPGGGARGRPAASRRPGAAAGLLFVAAAAHTASQRHW